MLVPSIRNLSFPPQFTTCVHQYESCITNLLQN